MTGWFGLPMGKSGIGILDDEVVFAGASSTYREFLSWFNSLYEQGLIDLEIFTQDSSTGKAKETVIFTGFPSHTAAVSSPVLFWRAEKRVSSMYSPY